MSRMGQVDLLSIGLATGLPVLSNVVGIVTDVYKSKKEQEAYDKAVKLQSKQQKKAEEEQRLALARARAQQTVDTALQLSTQRRQEQQMMLMIVGGVALVAAGVFVFSAVKKRSVQTGVKKK